MAVPTGQPQPAWLRGVAALAGLSVLAGLLLSLNALWAAHSLQSRLDRSWALAAVQQRLLPVLRSGGEAAIGGVLQAALDGEPWGFRYLALLDGDGQAVTVRGRYEHLSRNRWLPGSLRRWLRLSLYTRFADTGRVGLRDQERSLGTLEYVIADAEQRLVRDEAVIRLQRLGLFGAALSLLFGLACLLLLRTVWPRLTIPAARWRSPETPKPATPVPATPGAGASAELGPLFDRQQLGMLLVDSQLRVRHLNTSASLLVGWPAGDAEGQLIYTVFHTRDEHDTPLTSPAERCLQQAAAQPPRELRLRPRGGTGPDRSIEAWASPQTLADGSAGALMLFRDISERISGQGRLREQMQLAQAVVDHLSEGVLTTDRHGLVRTANARALRLFGYTAEEMQRTTVARLFPVPFMNTPGLRLADYIAGGSGRMPKLAGWRKDATTFPAELLVEPMQAGGEERLVVVVRDVSERLRSQSLAQRLGRLLDAASEEVYIFDAQSLYFTEVNKGARRNLGLKPEQLSRMSLTSIATDFDPATLQGYLSKLRGGDSDHLSYRTRHRRADGSSYPVEVRLSFSRDEEPPVYMAIALDISDREAAEKQMRQLAHFDPLTGLPNRSLLFDRLRQAMHAADRGDRQLGVFFLDLDGFKQVNDQHGHETGDQVLRAIADRLGSGLRAADTVARLGGDEFVVLAQGLRHGEDALRLADKIFELFQTPVESRGRQFPLSTSVGVSLYPLDRSDPETLLRHADAAMYRAKQLGKGQVVLHAAPATATGGERPDLGTDIQAALLAGEFLPRLRPVFALDGAVAALIAGFVWRHPRFGEIPAEEVLRAARRQGLHAAIEAWLLRELLRLGEGSGVALPLLWPLSARQWRDPEFAGRLAERLGPSGFPVRQLLPLIDGEDWDEALVGIQQLWVPLLQQGLRLALRHPPSGAVLDNVGLLLLPAPPPPTLAGDAAGLEPIRHHSANGRPLLLEGLAADAPRERLRLAGASHACGDAWQAPLSPGDLLPWLASRPQRPL